MATTRDRTDGVDFTYEDDLVTATDRETGVASCGESRPEALAMLSEALELHERNDEPASEAEQNRIRRELGIDVSEDERGIDSPSGMP